MGRGGADTLNMIVPHGDDDYYRQRPRLGVPAPARAPEGPDRAIDLDGFYGFHPEMKPLVPLYREGRLAIVQGVGSDDRTGSHFEAQDQMERGEAFGAPIGSGWLARHLRGASGGEPTSLSAVSIGKSIPESLRGAPAASAITSLEDLRLVAPGRHLDAAAAALGALYAGAPGLLGARGRETLDLLERVERLREIDYRPDGGATYPDHEFGAGLLEIARLIKADVGLQAACIDLDGWDTHFFQGVTFGLQANLIDLLARGLAAFHADLAPVRDRVTIVVLTEFGRRTYENGSLGTDHGRGFAMMALGEEIAGGRVHGAWPGLGEDPFPGPGGLPVRIDYRSALAEVLGRSFGASDLQTVFPGFEPTPVGLVR